MGFFKSKVPPPEGPAAGSPPPEDENFSKKYPTLFSYLVEDRYEDGTVRETATLILFTQLGSWKCCVNDKDGSRQAFVSGKTLEGLFRSIEKGLLDDSIGWRPVPAGKKK